MARYYEEETLFQSAKDELLKYFSDSFVYTSAELFHKVLANTPTADVVPKREVEDLENEIERLKSILNNYALQYGTVTDKQKVIDEAKTEVAREIIKDLVDLVDRKERLQQRYYETFYYVNSDDLTDFIAQLKKKYTEAEK